MSIMPEGGWGDLSPREKADLQQNAPPPSWTPTSHPDSSKGPFRKLIFPVVLLAALFLWHVLSAPVSLGDSHLSVNPLSDVVNIRLAGTETAEITDPAEKAIFESGMSLVAAPIAEGRLNLYARQHFDIYAWLVPYRVTFGTGPAEVADPMENTSQSNPGSETKSGKTKISDGPWGTNGTVIELSDREAQTMTRLNQQYLMDNLYIKNGNPTYIREAASLRAQMEAIIHPYIQDNPRFDGGWMCVGSDGTCDTVMPYSAPQ